eukprot:scaffold35956_cov59-Phaeocystis_antarctica.AAC.2
MLAPRPADILGRGLPETAPVVGRRAVLARFEARRHEPSISRFLSFLSFRLVRRIKPCQHGASADDGDSSTWQRSTAEVGILARLDGRRASRGSHPPTLAQTPAQTPARSKGPPVTARCNPRSGTPAWCSDSRAPTSTGCSAPTVPWALRLRRTSRSRRRWRTCSGARYCSPVP